MQAIFKKLGIYIHVPFCAKTCDYCRFYKRAPTPLDIQSYLEAIAEELKITQEIAKSHAPLFAKKLDSTDFIGQNPDISLLCRPEQISADTMFWGGGTPSSLSEKQIETLAETLRTLGKPSEWTVEVAPTGLSKNKLALLKSLGVTRISMGVQSFNQKTLDSLGRPHTLTAVYNAIENIAAANFDHFSIDLIFGAKNQTLDDWKLDIIQAAKQPVDHISAYCLEFESGASACVKKLADSEYVEREREGDFFETAMTELPKRDFKQYEISNYSKVGCECLHNLSTWNMARWIGLGPSAATQWRGVRRRNPISLSDWAKALSARTPIYEDLVELSPQLLFSDSVIFGLRTNRGVDLKILKDRFPQVNTVQIHQIAKNLEEENLLEISGDKIRLTLEGRRVADAVALEFL